MRVIVVAALLAPAVARADGRLSLSTERDEDAWTRAGFRLELGLVYGTLDGLDGAPRGRLVGGEMRAGVRLDRAWSILLSFQYAYASAPHELSGLRYAGTIDPTWHVTRSLSLAAGFGFGGIVEGSPDRPDVDPLPSTLESSYTFPDANTPLPHCNGVGAAGLVRVEWTRVLGPRAALTVGVEGIVQATDCIDDTGRLEPDTARPIVRRQLWSHLGGQLAVGITWR